MAEGTIGFFYYIYFVLFYRIEFVDDYRLGICFDDLRSFNKMSLLLNECRYGCCTIGNSVRHSLRW